MSNRSVNFNPGELMDTMDRIAAQQEEILARLVALETAGSFADHLEFGKRLSKLERFEGALARTFAGEVAPEPDMAAIEAATVAHAADAEKTAAEKKITGAADGASGGGES